MSFTFKSIPQSRSSHLDHPVNNRISFQMRQELQEAIEQVATSDARVLVIKAARENFSLGGDAFSPA
jgi:enoyl-CoA hydratase/carnithine racemase